ncbi:MAG: hypothetical protein QOE53_1437 [Pseudonocardiales bacterium]|jgi:glutaredoxin|nr:hypothetical protein [Pseudonocardiales bacterium]
MDIELLVVRDCPHAAVAERLVHAALVELGIDVPVTTTVIIDEQHAVQRGFVGSPTILVNGADPFFQAGLPAGLACRIYPTTDGPAGTPTPGELRHALTRAAGRDNS